MPIRLMALQRKLYFSLRTYTSCVGCSGTLDICTSALAQALLCVYANLFLFQLWELRYNCA